MNIGRITSDQNHPFWSVSCDCEQALTGQQHGVLFQRLADVVGFSSQRAFVDFQVVALDQDPISRQQVSCKYRGQDSEGLIPISPGNRGGSYTGPAFHLFLKTVSVVTDICFSLQSQILMRQKHYIKNLSQTAEYMLFSSPIDDENRFYCKMENTTEILT